MRYRRKKTEDFTLILTKFSAVLMAVVFVLCLIFKIVKGVFYIVVLHPYWSLMVILILFLIFFKLHSTSEELNIDLSKIDTLSGRGFEHCLAQFFQSKGYSTELTPTSCDQGADLIVNQNGKRTVIQAKRYSRNVSNSAVQQVISAKAYYNCQHAIVITNSYFTSSAKDLAFKANVELWDRDKLKEELSSVNNRRKQHANSL